MVTCKKNNNVGECLGITRYVPSRETHIVDSEPMRIQEGVGRICIENHTAYVLHVTIHEENGERGFLFPATTKEYVIEGGSVRVSIKNSSDQSCGWHEYRKIINGETLTVTGEPMPCN
jgi:hypothetical protein